MQKGGFSTSVCIRFVYFASSSHYAIIFILNCISLFFLFFIKFLTSCPSSSTRYLKLWMWLWSFIMKRFLTMVTSPLWSFKSEWKGLWNNCATTTTLHFANISMCVILHLVQVFLKKSKLIMIWHQVWETF